MNNVGPGLDALLGIAWVLALLLVGLSAGKINERRHLRRLAREEQAVLTGMLITDLRQFPMCIEGSTTEADAPALVAGEAVVSSDYFKTFLATLRKIIGGELRSIETLMSRARREAVLRMARQARSLGYDAICNVRIESTDIAGSTVNPQQKALLMATVLASGTAYRRADAPARTA